MFRFVTRRLVRETTGAVALVGSLTWVACTAYADGPALIGKSSDCTVGSPSNCPNIVSKYSSVADAPSWRKNCEVYDAEFMSRPMTWGPQIAKPKHFLWSVGGPPQQFPNEFDIATYPPPFFSKATAGALWTEPAPTTTRGARLDSWLVGSDQSVQSDSLPEIDPAVKNVIEIMNQVGASVIDGTSFGTVNDVDERHAQVVRMTALRSAAENETCAAVEEIPAPAPVATAMIVQPVEGSEERVNELRAASENVERIAQQLERADIYEWADALRELSEGLRIEARSLRSAVSAYESMTQNASATRTAKRIGCEVGEKSSKCVPCMGVGERSAKGAEPSTY